MEPTKFAVEQIAAEAAEWLLLFDGDEPGKLKHADFAEWLTRSPVHVREFLELSAVWAQAGSVGLPDYNREKLIRDARAELDQQRVVQLPPRHGVLRAADAGRPESKRLWFAAAAAIIVGLALWIGVAVFRDDSSYTTAVGEQRSIALADGSVIFLNTNSAVRVRYGQSARDIELIRGEARFQVAKSPLRPFTVATSVASVRALGTIFNVATDNSGTQVAVLEGSVEVRELQSLPTPSAPVAASRVTQMPQHTHLQLRSGQRAAVTPKGIEPDVGPSIESVNAWTQRRLVFRDMTLSEVIDQFNRYRRQPLVIDDPALGQMRVSGTFDPSDLDSLVGYLDSVDSVQVHTPADGSVHLSHIQP